MNAQANQHVEYGFEMAKVIAHHICAFNEMQQNVAHRHHSFVQQFSLREGLKKFGQKGHNVALGIQGNETITSVSSVCFS
jgi:hypothetical protein